jgi:hypothetical protein
MRIRLGRLGEGGQALLEFPAFGDPPRVHSGLAPSAYAGAVPADEFVQMLLERQAHVEMFFYGNPPPSLHGPMEVTRFRDWHEACT